MPENSSFTDADMARIERFRRKSRLDRRPTDLCPDGDREESEE